MKKLLCILFLMSSFVVNASTMVVWTCEMLEDGAMDDVKKINTAWVIAVNKLSESKVQSYVLEPIASINGIFSLHRYLRKSRSLGPDKIA